MENVIKLKNICKSYDDKVVLENFNCEIRKNQVNFIMGPSGRGKSTLLNILMGIEEADSGTVTGMADLLVAAVFQEDRLCENMSVSSNIRMVHNNLKGQAKNDFIDEVKVLLKKTGLGDIAASLVKTLSGGMKRRVSILRCILADSDILFFDEPLKGLDKESEEQFMEVVLPYLKDKIIVWVTHDETQEKYFEDIHMIKM